jgi:hypothetical protein
MPVTSINGHEHTHICVRNNTHRESIAAKLVGDIFPHLISISIGWAISNGKN